MTIPQGVTVTIGQGDIHVKGPKGELHRMVPAHVTVAVDGSTVSVDIANKEEKSHRALWGTYAAHVQNMIDGVTTGFKKQLEVNGVGYRVAMQGRDLKLEVGFSHPVVFALPTTVSASVEKNVITLESLDKELLGQTAAELRSIRKPEPYKGKGIKYIDEVIRRKAGKAAKAAGAA